MSFEPPFDERWDDGGLDDVGLDRRILEAGLKEFAAHGYEGTSVVHIARAAGVTTTQVRARFGGKEGLFHEVVRRACDGLRSRIGHRWSPKRKRTIEAAISDFFAAHQVFARSDREAAQILCQSALQSGLVGAAATAIRQAAIEPAAVAMLEKAVANGDLQLRIGLDARRAAHVLVSAAEIVMMRAVQARTLSSTVELTAAEAAELLLAHLRPR